MKIGIISDIHCDEKKDVQESWMVVGAARGMVERHPIQALISLARRDPRVSADVILCPGDLTHKNSQAGFGHAWDSLRDVQRELGATALFCTLGNHDVGSRSPGDPFAIGKNLHPDFPFSENEHKDRYWHKGFTVVEASGAAFAVINSAHDHYSVPAAMHGTFKEDAILALDAHLAALALPVHRIAMLHHHPVLHNVVGYDSADVLPTGDRLLAVLAQHGFKYVIHGHRHHPRVQRYDASGRQMHVIASGSFSVSLMEIGTVTRNTFHILEIEDSAPRHATLHTWEFNWGIGWQPATHPSAAITHKAFIGERPPNGYEDSIEAHLRANATVLRGDEIIREFPHLSAMLPDELRTLTERLAARGIKLNVGMHGDIDELGITHP